MLIKRTKLNPNGASASVLIHEYTRCRLDPIYFINTYCKIQHPTRGLIPFDLLEFQEQAIRDYQNNRVILQLAARQTYKTSLLLAYTTWFILFHPREIVVYATESLNQGFNCRRILNNMIEHIPSWLNPHIVTNNSRAVILENDSRVLFTSITACSMRGISAALVICDDFAYVNNQDQQDFYASVIPTIHSNSSIIIASTYGPTISFFDELYQSNSPHVHKIKWRWDIIPGRRDSFRETMVNLIGLQQWNREFMCISNGDNYGCI